MNDAERYAVATRKVVVDGEELWRATVREFPDLAEFADTREEAIALAMDAIETLKKAADEEGRQFPEPFEDEEEYSGRVTLRMSKSMHREVALRAEAESVSLNSYIVECVAMRTSQSAPEQSMSAGEFMLPLTSSVNYGLISKMIGETYLQTVSSAVTTVFETTDAPYLFGTSPYVVQGSHAAETTPSVPPALMHERKRARA
jgi:predicted HicB family RNase H-like nuclease